MKGPTKLDFKIGDTFDISDEDIIFNQLPIVTDKPKKKWWQRLLCKIGLHKYKFIKGDYNKYYECKWCGKRIVKWPVEGFPPRQGGYQPIDREWLGENK